MGPFHSAAEICQTRPGFRHPDETSLTTSDLMKPFSNRFEAGPDLPTEMSQHCMVQVNQTHTFVLNTDGSTYL